VSRIRVFGPRVWWGLLGFLFVDVDVVMGKVNFFFWGRRCDWWW